MGEPRVNGGSNFDSLKVSAESVRWEGRESGVKGKSADLGGRRMVKKKDGAHGGVDAGKKKKKSTHFPAMAVCYGTAVGPKKGKSTWGVEI